jgi:hypothetical protein
MGMLEKSNIVFWRATLRRGRTRQSASLQKRIETPQYSIIPVFQSSSSLQNDGIILKEYCILIKALCII